MTTPDGITFKYCKKGEHYLPETDEYFYRSHGNLCSPCKTCKSKHDKAAGKKQEWRKNNLEKQLASNKKWNDSHKEAIKQYHNNYQKQWRQTNKTKERSYRIRRRTAAGKHTAVDIEQAYKSQKGLCWWCSGKLHDSWEVDHRIPLSQGGTNWPENICLSCVRCNRSKGSKMPWEWSDRLL